MKRATMIMASLLLLAVGAAQAQTPEMEVGKAMPKANRSWMVSDSTTQGDSLTASIDSSILNNEKPLVVRLLTRAYGDSVVLRWATEDAGLWISSKHYGWMLYRLSADDPDTAFAVDRYGDTIPYMALNGGKPIKPLSLDEMMQRFDSTNLYAGVGAQALYGHFEYNINEPSSSANADFLTLAAKQYQEQQQRHYMAMLAAERDPQVAEAIGLRFVDRDVVTGHYYEYMIQSMIPPQLIDVENPTVVVHNTRYVRGDDEKIPEISVIQLDEHRVAVRWPKNKLSGYWLDRRADSDTAWTALTPKAPLWPMEPDEATYKVFGDSIAEWMKDYVVRLDSLLPGQTYTYRVRAFDVFGGQVDPREAAPFKMEDFIPPTPPHIDGLQNLGNSICKLTWHKDIMEGDFKGYVVVFANDLEGPWRSLTAVLPPETTSFTDSNAYMNGRGYYRVYVSDTLGNVNFSAAMLNHIEDITPPEAPRGLKAMVEDSTGVVFLTWDRNPEADVLGYRVYAANQKDHEFIEAANGYHYEPFFFDSLFLNTLTRYIYYYVVAVDNNYNTSKPSDTLAVQRPDHIAPTECVLDAIRQERDSVIITWHSSSSDDVAAYYVYRKPKPSPNWECVGRITADQVEHGGLVLFVDTPEPSVHPLTYCIEVRDSANNSSGMAGYTQIMLTPDNTVTVPITLKAKYKKGKTTLTWKYNYDGLKDYYGVIYRQDGDGEFHDIGTFSRKETSYIDTKVPAKTTCTYYIQLQLGRGRHSSPSNQATIKSK